MDVKHMRIKTSFPDSLVAYLKSREPFGYCAIFDDDGPLSLDEFCNERAPQYFPGKTFTVHYCQHDVLSEGPRFDRLLDMIVYDQEQVWD